MGQHSGSVHYFSPEHARGGFTDAKSDLYSLGVVMYEMVTGRVPFDADTPVSVALKHMQEEAIEPIVLNPDIPISVNKIIIKAMQKDANLRYQSATEMIKDLDMAIKTPDRDFVATQRREENGKTIVISTEEIEKEQKRNKKTGKFAKMKEYFEKHKGVKILTLTLIAILVIVLSFGITYMLFSSKDVPEVQVPNLIGLTMQEAETEATKLNLKVTQTGEEYDAEIEAGKIIKQTPIYQENYGMLQDKPLEVILSKGKKMVTLTKIVGKTKDEATKELKKLELNVIEQEESSDDVEAGYVTKQSIEEGQEIPAGSDITITVSTGIEQVEVPNLAGKTEADAKSAITNAKLKWKSTTKINDSNKPNGLISDQSISAGSYVDKDTEITITLNEFEEIKSGTITVNVKSLRNYSPKYEKQEDGTEVQLEPEKVQLRVMAGNDTIYDYKVSEDSTSIPANVSGTGTVVIKVYINDVLKKTESMNLSTTESLTID